MESNPMRTTVTLQDDILDDLMTFAEEKTKTAAVNRAVSEWVRLKKIERLKKLRGRLKIDTDLASLRAMDTGEA
jgi:hypothetical protein